MPGRFRLRNIGALCEAARGRHACRHRIVYMRVYVTCVDNGKPSGCVNPAVCEAGLWEYFVEKGRKSGEKERENLSRGTAAAAGREDKRSWFYCCISAILSAVHAMPLSASRQCWLAFKVSYTRVRASLLLSPARSRARASAASNCRERRTDRRGAGDCRGQVSPFIGAARRTFIRNRWTHCLP